MSISQRKNYFSTARQKNILVIGAGPSGMEAARLLAMQGHHVEIWEKDKDIGGTVRVATLAYEPNGQLIKYLQNCLKELKVTIKRNTLATIEKIESFQPDHVIVAVGATRDAPPILGKELNHVFDGEQLRGLLFGSDVEAIKKLSIFQQLILKIGRASQLLRNVKALTMLSKIWMPLSKNITIIGGDLVGLELAEFLIERGRKVTVLEPSDLSGSEFKYSPQIKSGSSFEGAWAILLTNVQINEITKEGVLYEHSEEAHLAKADQVIIAMGANPNLDLSNALQARNIRSTAIGDCTSVGYIHGAIADARNAVLGI